MGYPIALLAILICRALGDMLNVNINGFLSNTWTDNNCSEDGVVGCTTTNDDNLNDEVDPLLDTTNHQMSDDVDDGYFDKVDFVKLIGEGLLDLRENFNVTTAATCKISEFI